MPKYLLLSASGMWWFLCFSLTYMIVKCTCLRSSLGPLDWTKKDIWRHQLWLWEIIMVDFIGDQESKGAAASTSTLSHLLVHWKPLESILKDMNSSCALMDEIITCYITSWSPQWVSCGTKTIDSEYHIMIIILVLVSKLHFWNNAFLNLHCTLYSGETFGRQI